MKKHFLLLLASTLVVCFSACKKKYTCDCSTHYTFKNNGGGYTTIIIPADKNSYTEKMNKKQAQEACRHEQISIQTNFTNGITGNGSAALADGEDITTTCKIIL